FEGPVPMRPAFALCLLPLAFAAGCASGPRPGGAARAACPECVRAHAGEPPAEAVVFAADGIGGYEVTSATLRPRPQACRLSLCVRTVAWSHGYGRALADHVDYGHARSEGRKLAAQVLCYQQEAGAGPPLPVYLVSHSGGSAVVLAAAEFLPPDSVERIVLLAPSVSAEYDLRPALSSARQGIDAFHSERDWVYLGLGTALVGTADRPWGSAAGRVGFRVES